MVRFDLARFLESAIVCGLEKTSEVLTIAIIIMLFIVASGVQRFPPNVHTIGSSIISEYGGETSLLHAAERRYSVDRRDRPLVLSLYQSRARIGVSQNSSWRVWLDNLFRLLDVEVCKDSSEYGHPISEIPTEDRESGASSDDPVKIVLESTYCLVSSFWLSYIQLLYEHRNG